MLAVFMRRANLISYSRQNTYANFVTLAKSFYRNKTRGGLAHLIWRFAYPAGNGYRTFQDRIARLLSAEILSAA